MYLLLVHAFIYTDGQSNFYKSKCCSKNINDATEVVIKLGRNRNRTIFEVSSYDQVILDSLSLI